MLSPAKRAASLRDEIQKLSANDNAGFVDMYKGLNPRGSQSQPRGRLCVLRRLTRVPLPHTAFTCQVSTHASNAHLNRYTNVLAYDHSRVRVIPSRVRREG